jgi:uncharacterized LabA/DUF88 family protein
MSEAATKKTIALFVDVQNIYYTVRESHSCHFNYGELWRQLSAEGEIVVANAYAIERNDAKQRGFQQILRDLGFEVKLKPYIQRSDGSAKGDWDVGLAIDVMDAAASSIRPVDRVVLLSGDGDFDRLLKRVGDGLNETDKTVETIVYGVPSLTATSLIEAATEFRPIQGKLLLR